MNKSYVSIGSNIGNRFLNIQNALLRISKNNNIKIVDKSSVYETEPKYYKKQTYFYNMVILINTKYSPFELLYFFEKIEKILGRVNKNTNKPRIIDIDILTYDHILINEEHLSIPHKKMYERNFVLKPLEEINKNFICPNTSKKLSLLLKNTNDTSKVIKLSNLKL